MSDLPEELVGEEILARVPITYLKAVRSTCKKWEAITKSWVLGKKAAAAHEFVGFVRMNDKVYSLRYHLEDLVVDVSVKQVDLLNQLEIGEVYHCDGLVLCVAADHSKLVVWNPYLCQTRLIGPPRGGGEIFNEIDKYAIGYDSKKRHKILRFVDDNLAPEPRPVPTCQIYEIRSNSWRALKVNPKWEIDSNQRGVSVNGNTYFFAHQRYEDIDPDYLSPDFAGTITEVKDFLLCFDFTKERFTPPLRLPFHSYNEDCVTLSSFLRGGDDDEQLAVLFGGCESHKFEIWVTRTVEPNYVSWSKFLLVETKPLFTALNFRLDSVFGGSFFVDEANKVAVVFELDGYLLAPPPGQHMAFVFGQEGYIKSVNLGEALQLQYLCASSGKHFIATFPPLVCSSSYRPSLVKVEPAQEETHVSTQTQMMLI